MKNSLVIVVLILWNTALFSQQTGTFTDQRNGKTYKTVTIGNQTIMAENFAYKPEFGNCQSYENTADNAVKYGYLYDWETAKKIAPDGWHLPTKEEWKALCAETGIDKSIVFEKLIASGSSGFNAMFGGTRFPKGNYKGLGVTVEFWSASVDEDENPWSFDFDNEFASVSFGTKDPSCGFYVRLFKD